MHICSKDMIGSCRPGFNPQYRRNFSVRIFQVLSTLTDFNWIVSMVKSDLKDTYTITDSSCGSKSKWALVHMQSSCKEIQCICEWKKIIKYSLFLRQCKVYQPTRSQRKKGAKKKKNKKKNKKKFVIISFHKECNKTLFFIL